MLEGQQPMGGDWAQRFMWGGRAQQHLSAAQLSAGRRCKTPPSMS